MSWEDATSWAKSDEDRSEPRAWMYRVQDLRVTVHRLHRAPPDLWFVSCPTLGIDTRRLKAADAAEAKVEALGIVYTYASNYARWAKEGVRKR